MFSVVTENLKLLWRSETVLEPYFGVITDFILKDGRTITLNLYLTKFLNKITLEGPSGFKHLTLRL